jgi:hypothetical protein
MVNMEARHGERSASALWLGDGEVDQVAQAALFKGEFGSNWLFIIGANLQYRL